MPSIRVVSLSRFEVFQHSLSVQFFFIVRLLKCTLKNVNRKLPTFSLRLAFKRDLVDLIWCLRIFPSQRQHISCVHFVSIAAHDLCHFVNGVRCTFLKQVFSYTSRMRHCAWLNLPSETTGNTHEIFPTPWLLNPWYLYSSAPSSLWRLLWIHFPITNLLLDATRISSS